MTEIRDIEMSEVWREKESSLEDVIKKYPHISPLVILKTDVQRRGVVFSARIQEAIDPSRDAVLYRGIYTEKQDRKPNGLMLRDGTTIIVDDQAGFPEGFNGGRTPYLADIVDGKAVLSDGGKTVEEIYFWPKPDYFDKETSRKTPMWQVLVARPQRVDINIYQYCDFWREPNGGCKFCVIAATYHKNKEQKPEFLNHEEVVEAVSEAVKQPGRVRMIQLCAGSVLSGREPLDDEVDQYIKLLQALGKLFTEKKVMTQLIGTAYNEGQIRRLYGETILSGYTADIEVLNEDVFNYICPGKAKHIGYKEWRNRLFKAAEVMGHGAVNTGIVSGVELVQPGGFISEEEALETCLTEAEEFARHDVGIAQTIFRVAPKSYLHRQKAASLDYLIAFADGLDKLQRKYGLEAYFDDYRTCGNHPNTDLARI